MPNRIKDRCRANDDGQQATVDFAGSSVSLHVERDDQGEETIVVDFRTALASIAPESANRIRIERRRAGRGLQTGLH